MWCLIPILITVILAIIAVSFVAAQVINGRVAEWQVRLPPIPTAFTGISRERNSARYLFVHKVYQYCLNY